MCIYEDIYIYIYIYIYVYIRNTYICIQVYVNVEETVLLPLQKLIHLVPRGAAADGVRPAGQRGDGGARELPGPLLAGRRRLPGARGGPRAARGIGGGGGRPGKGTRRAR